MAKKSGLTKVAVKIGTAVGKADKTAHKFAKAGALAKSGSKKSTLGSQAEARIIWPAPHVRAHAHSRARALPANAWLVRRHLLAPAHAGSA